MILTSPELDETDSAAEYDARFTPQRPTFTHPSLDTPPPSEPDSDSDSVPLSGPDSADSAPVFKPSAAPSRRHPPVAEAGDFPPLPASEPSTESESAGSEDSASAAELPPSRRPADVDPVYQNVGPVYQNMGEVRRAAAPGSRGVHAAVSMDQLPRSFSVFGPGPPGPDEPFLQGRTRSQPMLDFLETAI